MGKGFKVLIAITTLFLCAVVISECHHVEWEGGENAEESEYHYL